MHNQIEGLGYRVLYIAENEMAMNGSRIYRCLNQSHMLRAAGWSTRVKHFKEVTDSDLEALDVLIVSRVQYMLPYRAFVEKARANGTLCIYETDDDNFWPPEMNESGVIRSGYYKENDPTVAEMMKRRAIFLAYFDAAVVSADSIAEHMEEIGLPTYVSTNKIDPAYCLPQKAPEQMKILYMSGTPTHSADAKTIESVLRDFVMENDATITMLGHTAELALPPEKVTYRSKVHYEMMLSIAREHSVCVVPLEITSFNNAKSFLKYVECGAVGVPVIVSPTREYKKIIRHGDNGYLAHNAMEWQHALNHAASDLAALSAMGLRAQKDVIENHTTASGGEGLAAWFLEQRAKLSRAKRASAASVKRSGYLHSV